MTGDDDDDTMGPFEEQMLHVWTVEAEFGHIVGHEDFQRFGGIPLEQLMVMREQWPRADEAATPAEKTMNRALDAGIEACFAALGVCDSADDDGRWLWLVPRDDDTDERAEAAAAARHAYEIVQRVAERHAEFDANATDELRARQIFHDIADEVEADEVPPWWQALGYRSLRHWKTHHRDVEGRSHGWLYAFKKGRGMCVSPPDAEEQP